MSIKLKLLKLLKEIPDIPCRPYCRKHLSYLSYDSMDKKGCLSKNGRIFKKPCSFLMWFPIDRVSCWPPIELALLSLMGWKMPTSTFEEQLRDLGFKGEMHSVYEES